MEQTFYSILYSRIVVYTSLAYSQPLATPDVYTEFEITLMLSNENIKELGKTTAACKNLHSERRL